jgi:hypothetical protein
MLVTTGTGTSMRPRVAASKAEVRYSNLLASRPGPFARRKVWDAERLACGTGDFRTGGDGYTNEHPVRRKAQA